jgi:hypothetical protein
MGFAWRLDDNYFFCQVVVRSFIRNNSVTFYMRLTLHQGVFSNRSLIVEISQNPSVPVIIVASDNRFKSRHARSRRNRVILRLMIHWHQCQSY